MIYKQVVFFVMKSSETNDTNTYLHTLSPHDALPISLGQPQVEQGDIEGGGVELLQGFLTGPDHFDLSGAVAQQHVLDVEGQDRVVLQDEQAQAWAQRWVTRCLPSSFGLLSGVLSLPNSRRWSVAQRPLGGGVERSEGRRLREDCIKTGNLCW